ncbi:hypothetical protein MY5147_003802 [Beauveria neobassiana]
MENPDTANADNVDAAMDNAQVISSRASRAYQLEMLQRSLKDNVIVAMDTGSGKTQIAILRIRAQLESTSDQKVIWFLAPTVLLCAQQFDAIKLEIPSISMRLVVGSDNVHTWSSSTWKSLLNGTQAVVSTYQVLLDALDHAFVKLDRLSLLIFDEGLTATPSMKAHIKGVEKLEQVLNAKCVSPSLHREELLKHVKRPQLRIIECEPAATEHFTETMSSLHQECVKMDILEDPYVVSLCAQTDERSKRCLEKVLINEKTWSRHQLSSLLGRSRIIRQLLGPWAADFYIWKAKRSFLQNVKSTVPSLDGWVPEEKLYVARILQDVAALEPAPRPIGYDSISDKVGLLLRELIMHEGDVTGIIFVQERATAAVLAALLHSIPKIRERYRVGCMVGTSHNHLRKASLYEVLDSSDCKTLQDFRRGELNLLVATSVLEEGIDIPACNLVICFDSPKNPKSFIQRRGRARMQDSQLIIFTDQGRSLTDQWAIFEDEIQKLCQDSERERQQLQTLERLDEDADFCFRVPHTGARLDPENAKQHLEHFCRVISSQEYTDGRPDYVTKFTSGDHDHDQLVSAQVFLPASLPTKLRHFQSLRSWRSEANAMKDAAFQAYLALYQAGLVNKNLLPLETNIDFDVETRAAIIPVEPLFDPWTEIAFAWSQGEFRWTYTVQFQGVDEAFFGVYNLTLPIELGPLRPVDLYLDYSTTCKLVFSPPQRILTSQADEMADDTSTLIALHYCHRWDGWPMTAGSHVIKLTSHDVRDAISARSAYEPTHYERLEFLGDSILKFCASMQAGATNLSWPEGYLTRYKDRLVANSRLSRAAVETGLAKFILTVPFTAQKWHPFFLETILSGKMKSFKKREMSTKVLADVVEALVGVAYIVGGIPKAIQCLSIFINECDWIDPSKCREEFFACAPSHCVDSSYLHILEELIGYSFTKKSLLLEATTHASYIGDISGRSWERLEFLGDAVLDYMIVSKLMNHSPPLPHSKMHMIKTAMVNKDFLAFLSLEEHELSQTESFVTEDGVVLTTNKRSALWRFIRHSSSGIGPAQLETAKRHENLRLEILHELHHGTHYPWHILLKQQASKFYSDLFEALVGAIWVDSGSLATCDAFLRRIGMLPYLDRVLADSLHMQHPKEELGGLAQARSQFYEVEEVRGGDDRTTYNCRLLIGGVEVGAELGGQTAEEARVGAATKGVAHLKAEAAMQSRDRVSGD